MEKMKKTITILLGELGIIDKSQSEILIDLVISAFQDVNKDLKKISDDLWQELLKLVPGMNFIFNGDR
jgi:DNA-binding protein YbaB